MGLGDRITKLQADAVQVGVPLELDIGVININTCEPMEDVLISLWVCALLVHSGILC